MLRWMSAWRATRKAYTNAPKPANSNRNRLGSGPIHVLPSDDFRNRKRRGAKRGDLYEYPSRTGFSVSKHSNREGKIICRTALRKYSAPTEPRSELQK